MKEIDGSSALLLGYGREGKSSHAYLHDHYPNVAIGIADKNIGIIPLFEPEQIFLGDEYLNHMAEFDVIVRSPGVPSSTPELQQAVKEGRKITSETNIFFSECPGVVVGVTGTKGKSTTSSLITHILAQQYPDVRLVGNIGKPALDHLSKATSDTIFVAELSSYQLEDIGYSPKYAVMLGINQEHLDHHGSFNDYIKAKQRIVGNQEQDDYVIFNEENNLNKSLIDSAKSQRITFSTNSQDQVRVYVRNGSIYYRNESGTQEDIEIMPLSELPLLGRGNLENVLAAITVSTLFDVSPEDIRKAIREFEPLQHRLEYIGEKNGIHFYDDSLATIPEAAINALDALGSDVETLIAGGFDRGISFEVLGKYIAAVSELKNLILFPTTGEKIWNAVENNRKERSLPDRFDVSIMEDAVAIALAHTSPGKICLLSPASPSFGIFKDYADRGDQFKKLLGL